MVPNWHYTYIFEEVLDQLRELGVSDETIKVMMEENPARWLEG